MSGFHRRDKHDYSPRVRRILERVPDADAPLSHWFYIIMFVMSIVFIAIGAYDLVIEFNR